MPRKYKAVVDISLRRSPDPQSPLYEQWHDWKAGTVFIPPKHMNIGLALEREIVEEVMGDVS